MLGLGDGNDRHGCLVVAMPVVLHLLTEDLRQLNHVRKCHRVDDPFRGLGVETSHLLLAHQRITGLLHVAVLDGEGLPLGGFCL